MKYMDELTWICLLQVFFQQAAIQKKLKPGRLKRRAGTAAGHSSNPVCCFCTHPPLIDSNNICVYIWEQIRSGTGITCLQYFAVMWKHFSANVFMNMFSVASFSTLCSVYLYCIKSIELAIVCDWYFFCKNLERLFSWRMSSSGFVHDNNIPGIVISVNNLRFWASIIST